MSTLMAGLYARGTRTSRQRLASARGFSGLQDCASSSCSGFTTKPPMPPPSPAQQQHAPDLVQHVADINLARGVSLIERKVLSTTSECALRFKSALKHCEVVYLKRVHTAAQELP